MSTTDDELLRSWRNGDKRSGAELFDRHFKALTRFFRNKVGDGIDDLIQNTFVGLLESESRFRGDGEFRSFVFGVAYNVLRNHYRASRRDAERLDFGVTSIFDLAPGPSEVIAERAEHRLLLEALRRLPVEHQTLLELYYWEPLTAAQIASIVELPEGTVRTRLRRAKSLLEDALRSLAATPALLHSTLSNLDDWARSVQKAPKSGD
ncbi:MAG: sigma-70 family RNA polymerase sigma factor [Myxococcota bacterium]